jgi:glycyl-tRNA synthetase beta chain
LADKIDTLTGFWAIDEKPTGSKDPFALRRAALGVIRLVLGNGVRGGLSILLILSIKKLFSQRVKFASVLELVGAYSDAIEGRFLYGLFEALLEEKLAIAYAKASQRDPEAAIVDLLKFLDSARDQSLTDEAILHKYKGEVERLLEAVRVGCDCMLDLPSYFVPDWTDSILKLNADVSSRAGTFEAFVRTTSDDLLSFFHDRLKVYLKDQGIRHDVIDACLAMPGNDDLTLLVKRAEALNAALATEDGANLVQGFKRANNILTQAEAKDGVEYSFGAEVKFSETEEERALFAALDQAEAAIAPAMAAEDFAAAMQAMAALRAPIDAFFTAVQINTENQIVRRNRLNLLHRIRAICLSVADLTKLEG